MDISLDKRVPRGGICTKWIDESLTEQARENNSLSLEPVGGQRPRVQLLAVRQTFSFPSRAM